MLFLVNNAQRGNFFIKSAKRLAKFKEILYNRNIRNKLYFREKKL